MRNKKIALISFLCFSLIVYAVQALWQASFSTEAAETAAEQQKYSISVMRTRGNIYDRNMLSLTDSGCFRAVVIPSIGNISFIKKYAQENLDYDSLLKSGVPFTVKVNGMLKHDGIYCFPDNDRTASGISASVLGYTDSEGNGLAGAELAYDDILTESGGTVRFNYCADAMGRAIAGEDCYLSGSSVKSKSGVVLTIDAGIQRGIQEASKDIKKGAMIVSELSSGNILASLSLPDYDPNHVENYLKDQDSPLIDRSLTAFTPGSVFKLCGATAALKESISPKESYLCTGSCDVDGLFFSCFGSKAHGFVNLHTAIEKSCNCYFIELSKKLPYESLRDTAASLGLGTETDTGMLKGAAGYIPESISSGKEYANTIIGQGDLSVTPVQMAGLISAIARNGYYITPNLFEGEVNEEGTLTRDSSRGACISVMEKHLALRLKSYMESTFKYGTASELKITAPLCGIKTGTAQTGVFDGETERVNYWYAGYIGDESGEKYSIVVLDEGNSTGINNAATAFEKTANFLYDNYF